MKVPDNPLTAVIVVLLGGAVLALSCAWITMPEKPTDIETRERGELLVFEGSGIVVEIITIDGVEYIVAKCRDGVGICPKELEWDNPDNTSNPHGGGGDAGH